MGTDIYGSIECRATFKTAPDPSLPVPWSFAVDLILLYGGRNYDAFGCLFGVRNFAGFEPVAPDRGIPADASEQTRRAVERYESSSPSWISWAEIEAIDWNEPAARPDARIHWYTRGEDGEWHLAGKAGNDTALAAHLGLSPAEAARRQWPSGTEWLIGDRLYRSEVMLRRDAISPTGEWELTWTVMSALARVHGATTSG